MSTELLAEFDRPERLTAAVRRCRAAGLDGLETFTPWEVEEAEVSLGLSRSRIPFVAFVGGLGGGALAYLLQWWTTVVAYPLDVGGRPLHSAPAFLPIAFEGAVLGAALAAVLGFLAFAGLPRLWHPFFEVEGSERASVDRFFLLVPPQPGATKERVVAWLREAGAIRIEPGEGRAP